MLASWSSNGCRPLRGVLGIQGWLFRGGGYHCAGGRKCECAHSSPFASDHMHQEHAPCDPRMGALREKAGVYGSSAIWGRGLCQLVRRKLGSGLWVRSRRIGSPRGSAAVGSSMPEVPQIALFRSPNRCLRGFLETRLGGVCCCCRRGDAWVLTRMARGFHWLHMRANWL